MKTKNYFLVILTLFAFIATSCSKDDEQSTESDLQLISSDNILLTSDGELQSEVRFTSNGEWRATCSASWIHITPSSGRNGTNTITLTAEENTYSTIRSTIVSIESGTSQKSIAIRQEPTAQKEADDYITPTQTSYTVSADGGRLRIIFSTNMNTDDLGIYSDGGDWISAGTDNRTRAGAQYVLTLNIAANTDGLARSSEIYFVRKNDFNIMSSVYILQQSENSGKTSTDFSADGTVRTLQSASLGTGIPIILMGDGFLDKDIANGTYDTVMNQAMENLFSEEPARSLRDYFDVYAVTAVSRHDRFEDGYSTAFTCRLEGGESSRISGDDNAVQTYAGCVKNINIQKAQVVVVANTPDYAGTTYWYSSTITGKGIDFAIAYCPVIRNLHSEMFREVVVHEVIGHGFAKLEDEYGYEENGTISSANIQMLRAMQEEGWMMNVDFTSDRNKVLWADFLSDSRYASEGLGVFEGGCTFTRGVYRPSYDSMMNSSTLGFNAPCRKEIYDKVMEIGLGITPSYEEFVTYDIQHKPTTIRRTTAPTPQFRKRPFAAPRMVYKHIGPVF